MLAVRSFRHIGDVIDAVTRTALYDRTKCKSKGFATLPGLAAFDPSADGAADLWMSLLQLILACFRSAGDASKERLTYDQAWKDLKQGDKTVGSFITLSELSRKRYSSCWRIAEESILISSGYRFLCRT